MAGNRQDPSTTLSQDSPGKPSNNPKDKVKNGTYSQVNSGCCSSEVKAGKGPALGSSLWGKAEAVPSIAVLLRKMALVNGIKPI